MEYMDPNKNDMAQTERKLFIASPIFTYDVNGDGKKEVVVCKNHSNSARILENFRWFGSGRIHFMGWNDAGLISHWTSQKLSGTVVGYQIADVDNDSLKELVVASVTKDFTAGLSESRLVAYKLK